MATSAMDLDGVVKAPEYESVPFYVGHHEYAREGRVTEEIFHHAEDLGYDFLSAPITNEKYRLRVLNVLAEGQEAHVGQDSSVPELAPLSAEETDIAPHDVSPRLLYMASEWIGLDSLDSRTYDIAKQALIQEISYAGFCGASNVVLHGPKLASGVEHRLQVSKFVAAVKQAQASSPSLSISVLLPLSYDMSGTLPTASQHPKATLKTPETNGIGKPSSPSKLNPLSSWDTWHTIRTACNYDNRINVGLIIPKKLPAEFILDRWLSEPVRLLQIPSSSFTPNQKNVDVLTKAQQEFLSRTMRDKISPWLLLSDIGPLPGLDTFDDVNATNGVTTMPNAAEISFANLTPQQTSPHLMYLREHLQRRQPARSPLEKYAAGYQDWPQSPLQPLADNLDSVTYEIFEKDPVKYAWYECAIRSALEDFGSRGWTCAGEGGGAVVVAVAGAGRGPLMQRVLEASDATGVDVDAWALEKNPSAFVHLQKRNANEWGNCVHLVHSDMRSWTGPTKPNGKSMSINILVSELLGSLADNELSPECLDGVQRFLHPTHSVSIPSSYTAFATPIAAQELWRTIKFQGAPTTKGKSDDPLLVPYVSWLHAVDYLSTADTTLSSNDPISRYEKEIFDTHAPKPHIASLWSFDHPIPPHHIQKSNHHNTRSAHHTFRIAHHGVCHGIAGYFEAVLYDRQATCARLSPKSAPLSLHDNRPSSPTLPSFPWPANKSKVILSTNPLTMSHTSPDMISWFPLFFPFKTPLYVSDRAEMQLNIWRRTDGRGVWYEWAAEVYGEDGGKVGESGWNSSEGVPCLM